jgi:hypothetical protein
MPPTSQAFPILSDNKSPPAVKHAMFDEYNNNYLFFHLILESGRQHVGKQFQGYRQ